MNAPHRTSPESLLSRRGQSASEQPISGLMATALANPSIISLAAGFVDNDSLPAELVSQTANRVLSAGHSGKLALQYGSNEGSELLRQEIARRNFGDPQFAERMILTAGSNQMLHLVSECLFEEGDIVLCAAPTYFVFLGLLKDRSIRAFGVSSDQFGIIPESLDQTLEQLAADNLLSRVKAIYLIPYFDNPGGTTIPADRRQALLEVHSRWHRRCPLVLLVDNAYRDLRYHGEDVPSMTQLGADPESTIETGTFSKNFSPGIRVGWGVLPDWIRTPVSRTKAVIDFGSAHLNQQLMLHVLQNGGFEEQLAKLRATYRSKLEAMLEACAEHLAPIEGLTYRTPSGGLYVWVELPPGVSASPNEALWNHCVEHGLLYVPGEFCFPAEGAPVQTGSIRLSFGVQSEAQIRKGIAILGESVSSIHQSNAVPT